MGKHSKGQDANLKHAWQDTSGGNKCLHCGILKTAKNKDDNCWRLVKAAIPGQFQLGKQ
jgi:hypothetical protein